MGGNCLPALGPEIKLFPLRLGSLRVLWEDGELVASSELEDEDNCCCNTIGDTAAQRFLTNDRGGLFFLGFPFRSWLFSLTRVKPSASTWGVAEFGRGVCISGGGCLIAISAYVGPPGVSVA